MTTSPATPPRAIAPTSSPASSSRAPSPPPRRLHLALAFAAIYLIWGSTYLAIRIAIETLPPFLMASARFLVAGLILHGWMRLRSEPRPSRREWRSAVIVGGLLLLGGNGGVVWAEQWVPSGIAALLVAMVPLWMVLLDWARPGGRRPRRIEMVGVLVGFAGVGFLVGPGAVTGAGGGGVPVAGFLALLVATLCWSTGSLYSRHAPLPRSPLLATGMEMIGGGALLLVAATLAGEWSSFEPSRASAASLAAVAYLMVFGSLVAFSAYVWLLRVTTAAKVATYAYVNPVVAVILGAAFANEPLTPRTVAGAAIVIGAVALLTWTRAKPAVATD